MSHIAYQFININNFKLIGNITPNHWDKIITTNTGKPALRAIRIMSEIVSWHLPRKIKDCNEIRYVKKFEGDGWRTSYEYLSDKFSTSKETIRRTLVELEEKKLIRRELKKVRISRQICSNVLFIYLGERACDLLTEDLDVKKELISNSNLLNSAHEYEDVSPQICGFANIDNNKEEIEISNRSMESNFCKNLIEEKVSKDLSELKTISFKPFENTKKLEDFVEVLTEEDCDTLRHMSGRKFSSEIIKQLLKAISSKCKDVAFRFKTAFFKYFAKCLKYEMRAEEVVNREGFRVKGGFTDDEQEIKTQEKYLNEIESSLETTPEVRLKKRLANVLSRKSSYNLLQSLRSVDLSMDKLNIFLSKNITLSTFEQEVVLKNARSIFDQIDLASFSSNVIDEIVFHMPKTETSVDLKVPPTNNTMTQEIQNPIWRSVYSRLSDFYGADVTKSWFSKLEFKMNEETREVNLIAPTNFIKDWIHSNYLAHIERFISEIIGKCRVQIVM